MVHQEPPCCSNDARGDNETSGDYPTTEIKLDMQNMGDTICFIKDSKYRPVSDA